MTQSSPSFRLELKINPAMLWLEETIKTKYAAASASRQRELLQAVRDLKADGDFDDYLAGNMTLKQAVRLVENHWLADNPGLPWVSLLKKALVEYIKPVLWMEGEAAIRAEVDRLHIAGLLDQYLSSPQSLYAAAAIVLEAWGEEVMVESVTTTFEIAVDIIKSAAFKDEELNALFGNMFPLGDFRPFGPDQDEKPVFRHHQR